MNQFTYVAHTGHVHADKADAAVQVRPVALVIGALAVVGLIVAVALIQRRRSGLAARPVDAAPERHAKK